MKKIINDPATVLDEMNRGFAAAYANIVEVHEDPLYVCRAGGAVQGKVGVISGGGSGHEPLGGGYVGKGMLSAAAPGAFFSSPTPDQILAATQAADGGAGVLHLILNYTGDILNFETGAELADMEDIPVTTVVINDDVAVEDSTWTAGRRGVAGAIVAFKLAGAAADRGDDLETVTRIAAKANDWMATMGLALSACTVPTVGKPSFELAEDEMELGIGVHGEPGGNCGKVAACDPVVASNEAARAARRKRMACPRERRAKYADAPSTILRQRSRCRHCRTRGRLRRSRGAGAPRAEVGRAGDGERADAPGMDRGGRYRSMRQITRRGPAARRLRPARSGRAAARARPRRWTSLRVPLLSKPAHSGRRPAPRLARRG